VRRFESAIKCLSVRRNKVVDRYSKKFGKGFSLVLGTICYILRVVPYLEFCSHFNF